MVAKCNTYRNTTPIDVVVTTTVVFHNNIIKYKQFIRSELVSFRFVFICIMDRIVWDAPCSLASYWEAKNASRPTPILGSVGSSPNYNKISSLIKTANDHHINGSTGKTTTRSNSTASYLCAPTAAMNNLTMIHGSINGTMETNWKIYRSLSNDYNLWILHWRGKWTMNTQQAYNSRRIIPTFVWSWWSYRGTWSVLYVTRTKFLGKPCWYETRVYLLVY